MVAVIAGEDHNRLVLNAGPFDSIQNFPDLRIHVRDRCQVTAHRFFLTSDIHFHIQTGFVIDSPSGNVIPVARDFFR